jgi:transposase
MEFIQGESRNQIQLFPSSIDEMISEDNTVRAIDIFVDSLNLETLDFNLRLKEGRPPYNPADLLKLFIYGYGYFSSFCASDIGVFVPGISVQTVPMITF